MRYALDVVGIGALNLDYITTKSSPSIGADRRSLTRRIEDIVARSGQTLERGVELNVDESTIYAAIDTANSADPQTALGGSAFNAIHAIAETRVGLKLGYVGVAGQSPIIGVSIPEQLDALGVDRRFVAVDDQRACGICFSLLEGADRTLLTHVGANSEMSRYLQEYFAEIVEYLTTARIIHVTSFLDDTTATHLLAVLEAVKKANTGTLICFDPGHVWAVEHTPAIQGIIRASDYLIVNNREFDELGRSAPTDSKSEIAERILNGFDNKEAVLVVKRTTGIWCYRREDGALVDEFYGQKPLTDDQIQDSTGAGDVFAAGLLIVLTYNKLQVELGSLLGMTLARHKLGYVGSSGHAQFAAVTQNFIKTLDSQRRTGTLPRGIFISHGRSSEWRVVQDFIQKYFDLPIFAFESDSWSGRQVTEALTEYMERCSFAICILTGEDGPADGPTREARQNVIHEVGLFQGKYGLDRVAVLVEDGCGFAPYTPPHCLLNFPHDSVDHTFYRLGELIRQVFLDDEDLVEWLR